MSERRHLKLTTEDQALAEIATLRRGYRQLGNWTLPMAAKHFVLVSANALKPPASPTPTPEQAARKAAFFDVILQTGTPPKNFNPPPEMLPTPDCDDKDVDRMESVLRAMKAYPHPLVATGPFGPVPITEFRSLQLMHLGHHLGFLVPTAQP